jgi:hypothetical protein
MDGQHLAGHDQSEPQLTEGGERRGALSAENRTAAAMEARKAAINEKRKELALAKEKANSVWSFSSNPVERGLTPIDPYANQVVPNNTPKEQLPMWASSLTSPKMHLQRIRADNWICSESKGLVPQEDVDLFVAWLKQRALGGANGGEGGAQTFERPGDFLAYALDYHVQLKLRGSTSHGLFARRSFQKGDVVLAFPSSTSTTPSSSSSSSSSGEPLWGLHINSETLKLHSKHAQARGVPSLETVNAIVSKRFSGLDPTAHPLFVDQIYASLFLACEKAAGEDSELYPWIRVLPSAWDDEYIKELHRGILEPMALLEYDDHRNRFEAHLRLIHDKWAEETRPPLDDLFWAMRAILSRQQLLPKFRRSGALDAFKQFLEPPQDLISKSEAFWSRHVNAVRLFFFRHICGVIDESKLVSNEFDPSTIATVTPLLDMIHHDPKGGNVRWVVEDDDNDEVEGAQTSKSPRYPPEVLLVATKDIAQGSELLSCFTRCYSVAYTLFRFGFLPLRDREQDRKVDLLNSGLDPELVLLGKQAPGALPDPKRAALVLEESQRLLGLDGHRLVPRGTAGKRLAMEEPTTRVLREEEASKQLRGKEDEVHA